MNKTLVLVVAAALFLAPSASEAGEIRVAVAANFTGAVEVLSRQFEEISGHKVVLAFSSTGKHYAQIKNGAPFEVFLAADVSRPRLLEEEGVAVPGSRFTYAIGRLVLWSPIDGYVDPEGGVLASGSYSYMAIANPKLAPYGQAAQEVLQARGLWSNLGGRLVRGETITQAFQYIKTGNADLGFVALAQVLDLDGSFWEVPQSLYRPIEQQAVLLKDTEAARAFLRFLKSGDARSVIESFGYATPSKTEEENSNE